ncbi:neutral zinc metallopeptidase [Yanghanlia caeni]|uniref:Neutral zinc metallopeptidase n=1 Tax=Yanghanlia caeni TaxID=3064283 RepID=A0ABU1DA43_9BURK|nr:neutral zinc metallopeptidase [Alcaligenaceae bacterium LG-2]
MGDNQLQQRGQGRVVPGSFTHGSSAQRMRWLTIGWKSGDPNQCDTLSKNAL